MDDFQKLKQDLGKLERNERQMTSAQKTEYEPQLKQLRKRITSRALKAGRDFLFSGIILGDDGRYAMERIRAVLGENEIADTEKKALEFLFGTYDLERFIDVLTPLHNKIFYLGYGPYWASHCRPVSGQAYYNDLIDMYWSNGQWTRKGKHEWTDVLPPTTEGIQKEYRLRTAGIGGERE